MCILSNLICKYVLTDEATYGVSTVLNITVTINQACGVQSKVWDVDESCGEVSDTWKQTQKWNILNRRAKCRSWKLQAISDSKLVSITSVQSSISDLSGVGHLWPELCSAVVESVGESSSLGFALHISYLSHQWEGMQLWASSLLIVSEWESERSILI